MAILLALACAAVYGVADFCGGRAARLTSSIAVTLIGQAASLLVAVAAVVIAGDELAPRGDWAWGAVAGVAGSIGLVSFYRALADGAMTVIAPVTAVISAVLPAIVGVAGGERPAPLAYAGIACALIAVALISGAVGERNAKTTSTTIILAVIAGIGFASIFIAYDRVSDDAGFWPLIAARLTSIAVMVVLALSKRGEISGVRASLTLCMVSGLLDMSANVFYLMAIKRGMLSIVAVIAALYPVSTVALAFGIDKEKVTRAQTTGMVLAAVALAAVSVAGAG